MSIGKYKLVKLMSIYLLTIVLFGCGLPDPCNREEVNRLLAPDGKVEVVVVKVDCGATTAESFNVFIVGRGMTVKKTDLVFQADHTENLSIFWKEDDLLFIKYDKARIFQFIHSALINCA